MLVGCKVSLRFPPEAPKCKFWTVDHHFLGDKHDIIDRTVEWFNLALSRGSVDPIFSTSLKPHQSQETRTKIRLKFTGSLGQSCHESAWKLDAPIWAIDHHQVYGKLIIYLKTFSRTSKDAYGERWMLKPCTCIKHSKAKSKDWEKKPVSCKLR